MTGSAGIASHVLAVGEVSARNHQKWGHPLTAVSVVRGWQKLCSMSVMRSLQWRRRRPRQYMMHVRGTVRTLRWMVRCGTVAVGSREEAVSLAGFGVGGVELLFVSVVCDTAE